MLETPVAIFLSMTIPASVVLSNLILRNKPNLRDGLTLFAAIATFFSVNIVFYNEKNVAGETFVLFEIMNGIDLAFSIEPLGLMFALLASGLWVVTHIYAVGYLRGNNEKSHSRFFACFGLAIFAVMGIAFADNMFTLFIFYEALTVATYPLVAHKGDTKSVRGARIYLAILLSTSICLQLVAIVWTFTITGTLVFREGGILSGYISNSMALVLLALYAFGIGKAALMPFHGWLPAAMVAPTPVSALLHAVAVVKAGVFTMLKVGIYIFGIDLLSSTHAAEFLMWVAAFSIIASSLIALTKDNLKERLAYSTVSQLSYITLGLGLANSLSILGGSLHIVMHAMGKITLFMCAGSIYVVARRTNISAMNGLGRRMPLTFVAFLIGTLSIIGLPLFGGSWSKWLLFLGSANLDQIFMIGVLLVSSLLNVGYLMPLIARGFFLSESEFSENVKLKEGSILLWGPPFLTSILCIVLFFYSPHILEFLMPIVQLE